MIFEPYEATVGSGTPFEATLRFVHDAELAEWSSMITFKDNAFNRMETLSDAAEKLTGLHTFYSPWIGPTAPNIAVEGRAERYWQDLCALIRTAASTHLPKTEGAESSKDTVIAKLIELRGIWAEGKQSSSSDHAIEEIDAMLAQLLTGKS